MRKPGLLIFTAIILTGFLLLSACAGVNSELARNRTLWQNRRIPDYWYRLDIGSNFRPPPMGNFLISVKGSKTDGYIRLDDASDTVNQEVLKYDTFEKIFEFLERSYENDSLRVDVTYNAAYGFPSEVYIYETDDPLGFPVCRLAISDFMPD